ncbi:MAG TPA: HAD family phosphatase [Verrucomicrobiae bacterium]|jgi:putative hydrolase of the HAD superfamily|nr:HAD family phosphatase [Verrucomicrobiae bacterium]
MKSKPEIKTVIFDLGNVLLNFDARRSALRFSKECKVSVTRAWTHFFTSKTEKAYTRGEITCRQFYEHAREVLKMPVDFKTFKHYWNDIFWENEGMDDLLADLSKRYPLYLISNTNKMHFDHIKKNFKILRHFKKTYPSHEVGARKPDVIIYERVLAKIGYKPEETVFVDDKREFIKGAKEAGMNGIIFRSKKQLIRDLKKLGVKI